MGAPTNPASGWYPDPYGGGKRRYWDGQQWTGAVSDPEVVPEPMPRSVVIVAGVLLALITYGFIEGVISGAPILALLIVSTVVSLVVVGVAWWINLPYLRDVRRKKRQDQDDRNKVLAINAEREHRAYLSGDDLLGMYGQFPPPPEVLDDNH